MIAIIILVILIVSVYLNARLYVLQLEYYHKYEATTLSDEQLDDEIEKLANELEKHHSLIETKRYEIFCDERERRKNANNTKAI